jgi:hypothetical protein
MDTNRQITDALRFAAMALESAAAALEEAGRKGVSAGLPAALRERATDARKALAAAETLA